MSEARPAVSDVVPSLERTVELPDRVAYAGAARDWRRTRYDAVYVAAKQPPTLGADGGDDRFAVEPASAVVLLGRADGRAL